MNSLHCRNMMIFLCVSVTHIETFSHQDTVTEEEQSLKILIVFMRKYLSLTHTHTHTHTQTLSHTQSHTHSLSHTL